MVAMHVARDERYDDRQVDTFLPTAWHELEGDARRKHRPFESGDTEVSSALTPTPNGSNLLLPRLVPCRAVHAG